MQTFRTRFKWLAQEEGDGSGSTIAVCYSIVTVVRQPSSELIQMFLNDIVRCANNFFEEQLDHVAT